MPSYISGDDNFDSGEVGGVTLLGTLAASGSSVTLSSVDLTNYKFLQIDCMNVQVNNNNAWYGLNGNTERYAIAKQNTGAGVSGYGANATCKVNLSTGYGFNSVTGVTTSAGFAGSYITYGGGHNFGVTTSTTSLTIYARSGYTLSQGEFKFYGIR